MWPILWFMTCRSTRWALPCVCYSLVDASMLASTKLRDNTKSLNEIYNHKLCWMMKSEKWLWHSNRQRLVHKSSSNTDKAPKFEFYRTFLLQIIFSLASLLRWCWRLSGMRRKWVATSRGVEGRMKSGWQIFLPHSTPIRRPSSLLHSQQNFNIASLPPQPVREPETVLHC